MSAERKPNPNGLVPTGNRALVARSLTLVKRGLELAAGLPKEASASNSPFEPDNQAIPVKPDDPDTWYNLGWRYTVEGKYDKAVLAYQRAIKLKPDWDVAWYTLGWLCAEQGRYDEAVAALNQAITLKPDDPVAWYFLGRSYEGQGRRSRTLYALDNLRKLDPSLADQLVCTLSGNEKR